MIVTVTEKHGDRQNRNSCEYGKVAQHNIAQSLLYSLGTSYFVFVVYQGAACSFIKMHAI